MKKKYEIVENQKFGRLTAIKNLGTKGFLGVKYEVWECLCECGKTCNVKSSNLRAGRAKSCSCGRKLNKNWGQKPVEKNSKYFYQSWFNSVVSSRASKRRVTECTLTIKELDEIYDKQNGKCFYTNQPLIISESSKRSRETTNISIDRIDNNKGYTKDNIVLCLKRVNICRNILSQEDFIEMCKQVFENFKNKQHNI